MKNTLAIISCWGMVAASSAMQYPSTPFGHISSLRPGKSSLAGCSFLFQGFPEGVQGLDFAYHDKQSLDFETLLNQKLSAKNWQDSLTKLGASIYLNSEDKPVLVMSNASREVLQNAIRKLKDNEDNRLMASVIQHYLTFDRPSRKGSKYINELRDTQDQKWQKVYSNVLAVSRELVIAKSVGRGWQKVGIYR